MAWVKGFMAAWKILKEAIKYAPVVIDWVLKLAPKIREWWNGKKIAVIGMVAVGKNCLYHRLKDEPIPVVHRQTKSPERVERFKCKRSLPDGKSFEVTLSKCTNVGGEVEQRDRFWLDACKDADVIFYMLTLEKIRKEHFHRGTRVYNDLKWLATHMDKMKTNVVVHLLVNKIDLELSDGADYKDFAESLKPQVEELEKVACSLFGDYEQKLTGISPTSMKDDHIFTMSFSNVLESVYGALHTE